MTSDTPVLESASSLLQDAPTVVTEDNFVRAETDRYFAEFAAEGAFGKLTHDRDLADVGNQTIVRLNRDTIYSRGLFDLDAGPVTIALPEAHGRFMSLLLISEDHHNPATYYAPGSHTNRSVPVTSPSSSARLSIQMSQPTYQRFMRYRTQSRSSSQVVQAPLGFRLGTSARSTKRAPRSTRKSIPIGPGRFGKADEVNPRAHLLGTAHGWDGNPAKDASYDSVSPAQNDGKVVHRLTVKDVPVDGFWSLTVYNADGFMEPNRQNAYSLNNVTAKRDADGGYTIQFGGCDGSVPNCLPSCRAGTTRSAYTGPDSRYSTVVGSSRRRRPSKGNCYVCFGSNADISIALGISRQQRSPPLPGRAALRAWLNVRWPSRR